MKRLFFILLPLLFCASCSKAPENRQSRVFYTSINKILATLDPALAADTVCQYMTAAFYDTPLQYSFHERPYKLEPSMLAKMPEISKDGRTFICTLRNDLYFQPNECFPNRTARRVTAQDAVFSILRLADARINSPGFWLIRGKIEGIDEFRTKTSACKANDMTPYNTGCKGIKVLDGLRYSITLKQADQRFLFSLAMPYFSIVSKQAVTYWKDRFADHPAGSGPFIMTGWHKDFQITMKRNPEYRKEFFTHADRPEDRTKQLPLLDEIVCSFVKQPMSGWLMFLQGELDSYVLDGENLTAVVNDDGKLAPGLIKRGIVLTGTPEFQTNYIGFNFMDPLLGKNKYLRQAVSMAFDRERRIRFSCGRMIPAYGPVPPGTEGYLSQDRSGHDLKKAKELMRLAGYPDGIDPKTGSPLELSFDQAGSDTFYRQTAELLSIDLKRIGIVVRPEFNNRARFLQKIRQGKTQLFRLSWTGDYPDAENFLQLFYGPNAGSSNRVCYSDPVYDRMFEKACVLPPSQERTNAYLKLAEYLVEKAPWIFESHTRSFILTHGWLYDFHPHDFAFNRWKYFTIDPVKRAEMKKNFTPLSLKELR